LFPGVGIGLGSGQRLAHAGDALDDRVIDVALGHGHADPLTRGGGAVDADEHAVAEHRLHREERDEAQHEEQPERRDVARAPALDVLGGQEARSEVQVEQRAEDARIDVEHDVGEVVEHLAQAAHHAFLGLPAGVAVRAMHRRATVGARARRHAEFGVARAGLRIVFGRRRTGHADRGAWRGRGRRREVVESGAHRACSSPCARNQSAVSATRSASGVMR